MVKLAIFDMDGTVFESYLDWKKIKTELCIENGNILKEIYNNTPEIQITKTFDLKGKKTNVTRTKDSSLDKPLIEFVDIPAGTFLMGSPHNEKERKDDEIQHEVTISSFKMSKYCVTIEQYNLFCEATGRKKPWYGRNSGGKMPVSQVSWYDAQAFAEWM